MVNKMGCGENDEFEIGATCNSVTRNLSEIHVFVFLGRVGGVPISIHFIGITKTRIS